MTSLDRCTCQSSRSPFQMTWYGTAATREPSVAPHRGQLSTGAACRDASDPTSSCPGCRDPWTRPARGCSSPTGTTTQRSAEQEQIVATRNEVAPSHDARPAGGEHVADSKDQIGHRRRYRCADDADGR